MNDGGPAFPRPYGDAWSPTENRNMFNFDQQGMSLRDYFAGQALAAYPLVTRVYGAGSTEVENAAVAAYVYADAMIRARKIKI